MLAEALTLSLGYNATLVTLGAAALGTAAGAVGAAMVLRGRALVPDALAHATLPGLAGAFLLLSALGADPRNLPLLAGGGIGAGLGLAALRALTGRTRLTEDTATAAVLSVAYGGGLVLLTVIQALPGERAAGLEGFLLGSTAGMLRQDAALIGGASALILAALAAGWRPLTLIAFDPVQARVLGLRTAVWDALLAVLVLAVVLVGLRVAGAILIVALLVTPAVAARLVTARAAPMAALAAGIGGACGWFGAAASAAAPGLPTGAVIVLAAFAVLILAALMRRGRAWTPPS
jgi:manganese/zinc/iron transport system permease protein